MPSYALSGQVTVTTAGTAVQATDPGLPFAVYVIRALAGNAGVVYVGNVSGDVTSSNGHELSAGDSLVYEGNLGDLWFDAATNGDKFSWFVSRGHGYR